MPTAWAFSAMTKRAAEWYRLAAERGDREAMFALAMLHFSGRTGAVDREQGAKLLAAAAKLGNAAAAYNLALLYIEGQLFPQDFARAAELFRTAAQLGNAEAQYALATLYKEGRGVRRIWPRPHGFWPRPHSPTTPMPRSIRHRGCSTEPASPRTSAWRRYCWRRPRARATRLRKIVSPNPRGRARRESQSGAGDQMAHHRQGRRVSDVPLDAFVQQQPPDIRAAGEKAAKPWVDALKELRASRS